MKLDVALRFSDPTVGMEIEEGQIADGITIERRKILKESVGEFIADYVIYIGKGILISVVAGLIAKYLYDRLKGKTEKVEINNVNLEVNVNVFNDFFLETLKKESPYSDLSGEREQHIYFVKFEFPEISDDELLKSARTLTNRPVFLNERQLQIEENTVMGEYVSGKLEVVAFITDEETNNLHKTGTLLYGLAGYEIRHSYLLKKDATFFTHFSIYTEFLSNSVPLREITRAEDMPSWLPPSFFRTKM
jgi:hypothetical protein